MTELPATFGKYYLTDKLATGGMAEIYLAKILGPAGFEKQLVIKLIHPKLSGKRHFVDMFVAEAKTLVALTHSNIVPVYELGVVGDTYFIAMEYIDGPTLYRLTETVLRQTTTIAPPLAAWIVAEILEGLAYAHNKGEGVIHRDLSPRNVMLSRDGEVKLVDFGIAVALGQAGESGSSAPTGSFPYMSPEQVRREPLSGQSDLFSCGVLLWEMLAGRRLFARPTAEDTLTAVQHAEVVAPSTVATEVPSRLDAITAGLLERDRDKRYLSAHAALTDLRRYLYGLDTPPTPAELSQLIGRLCPPLTQHTTEADDPRAATGAVERAASMDNHPAISRTQKAPSTAVLARRRGRTTENLRTQTFATHVALTEALARLTPMLGTPALASEASPDGGRVDENLRTNPPTALPEARETAKPGTRDNVDVIAEQRGKRPLRAGTLVFAIGFAALAAALTTVAIRGLWTGPATLAVGPAATTSDAVAPAADAPAEPAPAPAPVDASTAPVDASGRPDIRTREDAPRRPPGAGRVAPDAAVAVRGPLRIGANPWGEVSVNGVAYGRTPRLLQLPVGSHQVVVEFPASDPPQRKTFSVDVHPTRESSVFADFTR